MNRLAAAIALATLGLTSCVPPAAAAPTLVDRTPKVEADYGGGKDWRNSQTGRWYLTSGYLRTLAADSSWLCGAARTDLSSDGERVFSQRARDACYGSQPLVRDLIRSFPRPATHIAVTIKVVCTNWSCDNPTPSVYVSFLRWGLPA